MKVIPLDKDSVEILEKLIMRTMSSVDKIATEVAEIKTTLNESVLHDNKVLKERANRHRRDIDALEVRVKDLENSKKILYRTLIFLGSLITTFIIPVVAIIVSFF